MGNFGVFTTRLVTILVLHAAGVGFASPTVLVTRPLSREAIEWLPTDNQTVYMLDPNQSRNLELNTSSILYSPVHVIISPCSKDIRWIFYHGTSGSPGGHLNVLKENRDDEMVTFSVPILEHDRYVLQLSSSKGGAVAVSVRGEAFRTVRMRLRVRSRRRLAANWDPSPIDPQATTYCVVASQKKNYTSLCAAQYDIKVDRLENKSNRPNVERERLNTEVNLNTERDDLNKVKPQIRLNDPTQLATSTEIDNKIADTDTFNIYEGNFKSIYRKKKFSRSTKVADEDPVLACVGERTHHLIENLDASKTYYVSVFGVARDRRAGALLAAGHVRPRTSTAKRLKENVPYKTDIKGKTVYYFKATIGTGGGLWLIISTCGGAVDVEVLVRGKRLHFSKNIVPHSKFFVPVPMPVSSAQEMSEEDSVQFDSSSDEARIRYVIRITPSTWDRDRAVNVEVTASTTRWGANTPELTENGAVVRELRPRRSCKSVEIAFLPATHYTNNVIRYCITAHDNLTGENHNCALPKKYLARPHCFTQSQHPAARVIVQKVNGLKSGRKYAIQVTAMNKGSSVSYNILYVDTNASCRDQ